MNLLTKIYDNFDGERSIYAFDQRGHGLSEAEADHKKLKSWRQFSKEAITFLNALGHESVELMGHSMGGIVASEIASQLKLKVNNLIMLEPVLYYEPKEVIKLKIKSFYNLVISVLQINLLAQGKDEIIFLAFDEAVEHFIGRAMFISWPEESIKSYLKGGLVKREGSFFLSW